MRAICNGIGKVKEKDKGMIRSQVTLLFYKRRIKKSKRFNDYRNHSLIRNNKMKKGVEYTINRYQDSGNGRVPNKREPLTGYKI